MLDKFYSLYKETALRNNFSARPKSYFKELFHFLTTTNYGFFYWGYWQKKLLSVVLITFFGKYATYLYGASSSEHKELMAPYLLQWQAIKQAKKRGCSIYDMGAIAPFSGKHPWSGLRGFKIKFGGKEIELPGCFDFVYRPIQYTLFAFIERYRSGGYA